MSAKLSFVLPLIASVIEGDVVSLKLIAAMQRHKTPQAHLPVRG